LIRFLAFLAAFSLFRLAWRALFRARPAASPSATQNRGTADPRIAGQLVHDPVCGVYLPADRAVTLGSGENTVHFCSQECLERYRT
jgi:YHS domain-containing protein